VNVKSSVFWNLTPWIQVEVDRRFGGTYYFHPQNWVVSQASNTQDRSEKLSVLAPLVSCFFLFLTWLSFRTWWWGQDSTFQENRFFLTRRLITLTHSWRRALLEKPPIVQLLKNFPAFYGTRRFITVLTRPSTGPYPEPDRSSQYHLTLSL
jgi:hypothetical protein